MRRFSEDTRDEDAKGAAALTVTISVSDGRNGSPLSPSSTVLLVTSRLGVCAHFARGPKSAGLDHILASPPLGHWLRSDGSSTIDSLQPLNDKSAYHLLSRGSRHGRGGSPASPLFVT